MPGRSHPSTSREPLGASEWHLITSEYPPAVGGVSDYAFTMAGALGRTRTVHVWCPRTAAARPAQPNVHIHDVDGFSLANLRALGRGLDACAAPRRLFVQWTPQGFGYRSLNIAFATWLLWRRWVRHDTIDLMVHEPYLRWSVRPARAVAACVHRLMLITACASAARVWVSTTAWLTFVRPYLWSRAPLRWLPLPAPAPLVEVSAARAPRIGSELRVGHFSMFSSLLTPLLRSALEEVLAHTTASILLIGRGSSEFRASFVAARPEAAPRVHATGAVSPLDVHRAITSCDVMVQPYPDGVTSRRTSLLTTIALGIPTVTNRGALTEPLWNGLAGPAMVDAPDGVTLGQHVVRLIGDTPSRQALGAACRESYERLFDARHAFSLLEDGTIR